MKLFDRLWNRQVEPSVPPTPVSYQIPRQPLPEMELYDDDDEDHLTEALRAQRRAQTIRPKKWLTASQIAERFVAYLRLNDYCQYPHLVDDIDEAVDKWCERNNVEPVALQAVREAMSCLPGVSRAYPRLSTRNPRHKFVLQRLKASGRTSTRATLYSVSPLVPAWTRDPGLDTYGEDEPVAHIRPATQLPPSRRTSRPKRDKRRESDRPDPYEGIEIEDDPPSRRVA